MPRTPRTSSRRPTAPTSTRLAISVATAALIGAVTGAATLAAQSAPRSLDGFGNNETNVEWGASGTMLLNRCRTAFTDSAGAMPTAGLPNARTVSNVLFAQEGERFSESGLNDLWWAFGQFLDHDITLTGNSAREFIGIAVPVGDPMFDPDSTGRAVLPMSRSISVVDGDGLRRFENEITAFIDGSAVYGVDEARAAYLRAGTGGRMRLSAGGLPPLNTLTGEYAAPVDAGAPHMEGQRDPNQRLFVCGDVRANENGLLLALHTLWLREHNRIADSLARRDAGAGDEELYQDARTLVGAQLQHITYEEWLPALGVDVTAGPGYDPAVDPTIGNEFAAAAFRFGHTLVGRELWLVGEDGSHAGGSPLALRDAFFDPVAVLRTGGTDALLRGAARHRQQELDCGVVDDLRNFLFGAPGAGGLDLAAVNVNRGRDRGVARLNDLRRDMGMAPHADFGDVTGDPDLAARLRSVYGRVDSIEAWPGLLAEDREGGVGPTLRALLDDQFARLRAGDRYFYAWDDRLDGDSRAWVRRQTLNAVLRRNAGGGFAGESFRAAGASGVVEASAKTGDAGAVRAYVAGGELRVVGLRPQRAYELRFADALGRGVQSWSVVADARGAARAHLTPGRGLGARVYVWQIGGAGHRASGMILR